MTREREGRQEEKYLQARRRERKGAGERVAQREEKQTKRPPREVGRRRQKSREPGAFAGSLGASPGPGFSGFPPSPGKARGAFCGLRLFAPDPDLVMPLIWFLNSGLAAAGPGRGSARSPSLNLQIGLHFGHFDGPVIVSPFANFQFPPPGWGAEKGL